MWILNALIVHILLLGSIFVIYFRSPVITKLQPQKSLTEWGVEPPAHRLVLFVTDGLRAESFFRRNCSDIPNLRSIFQRQGIVGVSHTHVPTESRPGHIALIAGLYEDPSAVTRGWKENPIDFDTVFNRSAFTYAWGAHDVLHIFERLSGNGMRMLVDAYNHDLDFSGHDKTYKLDEWVFKRTRALLERKSQQLQGERQVVFFLHLLGLDTAGHVHKPGTDLFLENLHHTERGVVDIYEYFERIFPDQRTAYVLTSDHGMTNTGSHGAGDPLETETPFFLWGAGIQNRSLMPSKKHFNAALTEPLPLHELEQAQFAPLMSSLIGVAPPTNNFGILPKGFLNVTAKYEALAAHTNALQLLEQFKSLLDENQVGIFTRYLHQYPKLNRNTIAAYVRETEAAIKTKQYNSAMAASYQVMSYALEGIQYYHGYYRNSLLIATTFTFVGWLYYVFQLLIDCERVQEAWRKPQQVSLPLVTAGILLITFALLQRVPWAVAFYLLLPVFVWHLALKQQRSNFILRHRLPLMQLFVVFLSAEFMVFAFFRRQLISLAFLIFALVSNYRCFLNKNSKFYIWLCLVGLLAIFPLLPVSVGYKNPFVLVMGMVLSLMRPILTKSKIGRLSRLTASIGLGNALFCIYHHANLLRVPPLCHALSWGFMFNAIIHIFFSPTTLLRQRLELIFLNLSCIYAMLSMSYEPLFLLLLASELMLSLSVQETLNVPHFSRPYRSNNGGSLTMKDLQSCLRLGFSILLYTFFSFFGTGNIVSVSSFDPNIIRCFLSTFSPFVIMTLVILKLVFPVILIICIVFGISSFARAHERQIFMCLLLICDVMGLNFLFLVRNEGSWLEIGSSISHFVIMECTTLVLLLLTGISKFCLRLPSATAANSNNFKYS